MTSTTPQTIVLAGASGFIGTHLAAAFRAQGDRVVTIGRGAEADARWGETAAIARLVDGADLIVNMAGKSVNCRYTPENRAEIMRSRIETTAELSAAVRSSENPPPLWVNSSTATIYRHAEDRPMTESTGDIGRGFSVGIATAWEKAFFADDLPSTRRVALRMAIVLGDDGALVPMVRLARFGLGGPQWDGRWFSTAARRAAGTFHEFRARWGRQRFSWIHVDDVLGIIRFVQENDSVDGVLNAAAPNPSDNVGLMRSIRRVLGIPFGLPAPRIVTEIGSALIRTETELILKSRWVVPERLESLRLPVPASDLEPALSSILTEEGGGSSAQLAPRAL